MSRELAIQANELQGRQTDARVRMEKMWLSTARPSPHSVSKHPLVGPKFARRGVSLVATLFVAVG